MIYKIKSYPVALTGLALGVIGLCSAWATVLHQTILYIGVLIAIIFLSIILIKNIVHFTEFINEIKNPIISTFIPTFDMALMIIASAIVPYVPLVGKIIWSFAILLHFVYLGIFLYCRAQTFSIEQLIPSWFIPTVGIVIASVTGTEMGFSHISQGIFYFGFIWYLILLPVMFYRLLFVKQMEQAILPSFGVMAAAPNLCLSGYLTAFSRPQITIIALLVALAIFSTFLVYISIFKVFRMSFSPIFSSYTFPLSIGITSMIKFSQYLYLSENVFYDLFEKLVFVQLIVATIIIIYVFIQMMIWLNKNVHNPK